MNFSVCYTASKFGADCSDEPRINVYTMNVKLFLIIIVLVIGAGCVAIVVNSTKSTQFEEVNAGAINITSIPSSHFTPTVTEEASPSPVAPVVGSTLPITPTSVAYDGVTHDSTFNT